MDNHDQNSGFSQQNLSIHHEINEFGVFFRKEALEKLKHLALVLNVPEDRLGDVLIKGLHIIDMAKDDRLIIERKNECIEVDIKKL